MFRWDQVQYTEILKLEKGRNCCIYSIDLRDIQIEPACQAMALLINLSN